MARRNTKEIGIDHEELYTLITPALAEQLLEKNTHNRPLRSGVVERYARDMKAGDWLKNGVPITIDSNGAIHNGQHRLWAIMESGVPQEIILLTGLDPATVMTVDNGAKRSYADYRQIKSRSETGDPLTYANEQQATLRWLWWYEHQWPALSRGNRGGATFAELDDLTRDYPEVAEATAMVCSHSKLRGFVRRASMSLVLTHALRYNRDAAVRFIEVLKSGIPSYEGDAAIALRERLTAARLLGKPVDVMTEMVFIIKAWNAFAEGKPLKAVRWLADEITPAIIGTKQAGAATSKSALRERGAKALEGRRSPTARGGAISGIGKKAKRGPVAGKRTSRTTAT